MADEGDDVPIHRLVDMEVEEVSLVDRAANKRRFLVVKRSEGMGQEGGAEGHESSDEGHDGDDGQSDDAGDESGSSLDGAAAALEGLTGIVSRLQSADEGAQREGLQALAQELRQAAASIEESGPGTGGDEGDDDDSEDDEPGQDEGDDEDVDLRRSRQRGKGKTGNQVESLVSAVTALVGELRTGKVAKPAAKAAVRTSARGVARRDDDDESDEGDDEPAPRSPRPGRVPKTKAAAGSGGLRSDLHALRTELKAFTGSLQEHGRRLSKLEKRSGSPASRSPGERPGATPAPAERAWPLDLNAAPSR